MHFLNLAFLAKKATKNQNFMKNNSVIFLFEPVWPTDVKMIKIEYNLLQKSTKENIGPKFPKIYVYK